MSSYDPAPVGPPASQPPPSNLVWGIVTTILCCLPAGVVSIVYAAQVGNKWGVGDFAGAQESSRKARMWAIVSVVIALVVLVLYVILLAVGINLLPEQ